MISFTGSFTGSSRIFTDCGVFDFPFFFPFPFFPLGRNGALISNGWDACRLPRNSEARKWRPQSENSQNFRTDSISSNSCRHLSSNTPAYAQESMFILRGKHCFARYKQRFVVLHKNIYFPGEKHLLCTSSSLHMENMIFLHVKSIHCLHKRSIFVACK